jgi:hypothetical protein
MTQPEVSLFTLSTPVLTQGTRIRVVTVARKEAVYGPNNLLQLTKADLATISTEFPPCKQQEPTPNPQYGTMIQRPISHTSKE